MRQRELCIYGYTIQDIYFTLYLNTRLQNSENFMELQTQANPKTQRRTIEVGAIYRHYSGKEYRIIAIGHDSEDPTLLRVVYQGLYDCPAFGKNPIWIRPYDMFAEKINYNGQEIYRFSAVTSI